MPKQSKQPPWFKMWLRDKPLIDVLADAVVGKAVKAAMAYFATGEVIDLEPQELALFAMIQSHIDEAYSDYQRDVENGKKGGRPKAGEVGNSKPPVKGGNPGYPPQTEVDGEVEVEGDEREIEKDIEIYQEGIGDREGPGGEEPVHEKDFETLRREKLAMLAGVR